MLADHFRVLVPEQRGRGRSDYDRQVDRYNLLQYVQDVRTLLESLNIERTAIVGTSMGGLMTFALSALHPGTIDRAVINDIGPEIALAGLERINLTWDCRPVLRLGGRDRLPQSGER